MRFGVGPTRNLGDMRNAWSRLDDTLFAAVYVADHFATGLPDPWTVLAYAAAKTERIQLGTHVSAVPLHSPARLAAQVATVDSLSNGRARLGVGTGHARADFDLYGFTYEPIKKRIEQLQDSLVTMKGFWRREPGPFPESAQKPHPPIIVGVNTAGRLLEVAAEHADGINTWGLGPEEILPLRDRLRSLGCDLTTFELTSDVLLLPGADETAAERRYEEIAQISKAGGRGSAAFSTRATGVLWGDESNVRNQVAAFAEIGVSELAVSAGLPDILWFSEKVIPHFR
jgi:alkanesulfonate monooxygenase SsuD/methylene tetrahydromethanopterin reductase-like flavin-dependent oxidoreductase (luciferase family)